MSETPRQKGRPKDPLKTQAILQAARKLFLEQGLEVTTAEIARVAGVAKATLYANFSDKEHLIEAVLRQESDLTISDHDFAQRHHLPLIEVLTAFGYRFVRFINQRELTGWDRLIASAAVRHPDLPGRFYAAGPGRAQQMLEAIIAEAIDRSRYFTSLRSAGGCRRTGRFMAGNDQPGDKTWRKTSAVRRRNQTAG